MNDRSPPSAPQGPCFITGADGYFSFEEDYRSEGKGNLYGVLKGFFDTMTVYDAQGNKWKAKGVVSKYKRTWWWVLLANTVYNPRVTVRITWGEPRPYHLLDLKEVYVKAVEKDDDILTQFVEAGVLKERIGEARNFGALAEVYRWMATDHGRKVADD